MPSYPLALLLDQLADDLTPSGPHAEVLRTAAAKLRAELPSTGRDLAATAAALEVAAELCHEAAAGSHAGDNDVREWALADARRIVLALTGTGLALGR